MMKSAVNALYKLLWNLDHYCPHEMFPDRERFVIEVSTRPTTSAQKQRSERAWGKGLEGRGRGSDKGRPITVAKGVFRALIAIRYAWYQQVTRFRLLSRQRSTFHVDVKSATRTHVASPCPHALVCLGKRFSS
jgi:hypothetical protein